MLNPTLFNSPQEMVEHRHRLNSVIFLRTKADACKPDGSTLFARRQVHTEASTTSPAKQEFYQALVQYLQDGLALAKRKGKQGQGLAFVMTVFQKIAASSFAAVQRTLRRRLYRRNGAALKSYWQSIRGTAKPKSKNFFAHSVCCGVRTRRRRWLSLRLISAVWKCLAQKSRTSIPAKASPR